MFASATPIQAGLPLFFGGSSGGSSGGFGGPSGLFHWDWHGSSGGSNSGFVIGGGPITDGYLVPTGMYQGYAPIAPMMGQGPLMPPSGVPASDMLEANSSAGQRQLNKFDGVPGTLGLTALDNSLRGGAGNDTLRGGAGNDSYVFDTDLACGSDTINEAGGGIDTLDFSKTTARAVVINLANAAAQVVNAGLTLTALNNSLTSGAGNDTLRGVAGNDVLSGGTGNDRLGGGAGRNILIGGAGADALTGGSDQDLMLGARYIVEDDIVALTALRSEWSSANTYANRMAHLLGTLAGGANGTTTLTSTTVQEDAALDTLRGGSGKDWYLRNSRQGLEANRDTVTDAELDSAFTEIDDLL